MKKASARWMTMASALVAITALNLACSSSNSSGGDAGGTGGKTDSGGGTGGKVDSGSDVQVTHALTYNFDSSVEGFTFNNGYGYSGPDDVNLAPPPPSATDAATDAAAGDGGVPIPLPTITLDTVNGKPSPGSLKISVTFTACNQFVEPALVLSPTVNLTGKVLHAQLAIQSGAFGGTGSGAGAQLYLQTGPTYAGYTSTQFILPTTNGTFNEAVIDLNTAVTQSTTALDPTTVIHIGVKIYSGYGCTTPYANAGVPVVLNIDSFTD